MKKIDYLVLKSYIGPLVLTFFIAIFVLLMQFLWKYVDDLVGKGLPWNILPNLCSMPLPHSFLWLCPCHPAFFLNDFWESWANTTNW
jgi:lipopolysaccharide export LptBFGC system permease protein LptF